MRYLDADQVIAMHETLLAKYGGAEGGGHRGLAYEGADAAVQAVKNSYYETVYELAAAYAVYIVQGHVFMDGNKRSGLAAMLTFLTINGAKSRLPLKYEQSVMLELQQRSERGEDTGRLVAWIAALLRGEGIYTD